MPEEREWMDGILDKKDDSNDPLYIDALRHINGEKTGLFTWFDPKWPAKTLSRG